MTSPSTKLYKSLTYLGALPFIVAVYIGLSPYLYIPEFLGGDIVYSGFKSRTLAHSYAVVILTFLGGIQWGLSFQHEKPNKLLIISTILALLAWISLMAFASKTALVILLIGFIVALFVDSFAHKKQLIPTWFWRIRIKISTIVCISMLVLILLT